MCSSSTGRHSVVAQANNIGSFACPHCAVRQPIGGRCPTNWLIKSHIDGLRNAKLKRKRAAPLPPPQYSRAGASTCPRHANAAAEDLCVNCAELTCIHCEFDCAQKQHRCVKADAKQASTTGRSADDIGAAFERGKKKIQARLDRDIRQLQAAAEHIESEAELTHCSICRNKFDCNAGAQVLHILPS